MISEIITIITIPVGGGNTTITVNDNIQEYIVDSTNNSSVTLSGNYTIAYSGTPVEGTIAVFNYRGIVQLNGYNVTILGRTLTQEESTSKLKIFAEYNGTSSSWNVICLKESNNNIVRGVGSITMNTGGTVTLTPGINKTVQYITGSPTLASNWSITSAGSPVDGDTFTIYYYATPTIGSNTVTIFGVTLTPFMSFYNGSGGPLICKTIYSSSYGGWMTNISRDTTNMGILPIDCQSAITDYVITIPVSFENGEQGNNTIMYIPHSYQIIRQSAIVVKAIAGTDNGTITIQQNGSTVATLTLTASSAVNTTFTSTNGVPTTTAGNTNINLISAKTTAGGKALVSLVIRKIGS
jgi:hypothetical protein